MLNQIVFFTVAVGIIQSILFASHWVLYKTIIRFFAVDNQAFILYLKIILGIFSISFVSASYLSFYYYNLPVKIFYNLAAGWLGFLYLFLIASAIIWVFGRNIARYVPTENGAVPRPYIIILFILAVTIGIYGLANANNVQVTRLNLKLNDLPDSWRSHAPDGTWRGKTAVWISDIHLGQVRGEGFSRQIVNKINNLNPDVVFVGGDLFDGVAADFDKLAEPFANLKPPLGTYYITGNHEEFDGKEKFLSAVRQNNMRILDNQMVDLAGVQLIGVDYRDTSNLEQFKQILSDMQIDKNKPTILLKHSPYYVEEAEKAGIDLQLSGHTHQGQIFPIQYISRRIFYGYEFGLKKLGNLLEYTSSGAGTWGPPFRLGTQPEIVQITFR